MYLALDHDELVIATPRARASCPGCGGTAIAKCGEVVTWHWAHERGADCDTWSEGESEWHLGLKKHAHGLGCRVEVTYRTPDEWHRADVVRQDGVNVELQHSPLGVGEALDRERFYRRNGGLIWVFDARDRYWPNVYRTETGIWWQRPSETILALQSPMYWDTEEGLFLVRVSWNGDYRTKLSVRPAELEDIFSKPAAQQTGVNTHGIPACLDASHQPLWFTTYSGARRCRICSPLTRSGEGFEKIADRLTRNTQGLAS